MERRSVLRRAKASLVGCTLLSVSGCVREFRSIEPGTEKSSETATRETDGPSETIATETKKTAAETPEIPGHSSHRIDLTVANESSDTVNARVVLTSENEVVVEEELQIPSNASSTISDALDYPRTDYGANTYLVEVFVDETKQFEDRVLVERGSGIHKVRLTIGSGGEITMSQVVH